MTIFITKTKAKRDVSFTYTTKVIAAKRGMRCVEKVKYSIMNVLAYFDLVFLFLPPLEAFVKTYEDAIQDVKEQRARLHSVQCILAFTTKAIAAKRGTGRAEKANLTGC